MFSKKYIFETRRTRVVRYGKNTFVVVGGAVLFYSLLCLTFISVAKKETEKSNDFFFSRDPDLIVVFTGDNGRIPFALKSLEKSDNGHLFITGVYSANTVRSIIRRNASHETIAKIDSNKLYIDYQARNTVENVISTLHYLRRNKMFKTVKIISHDYHIMRIKLIFNKFFVDSDQQKMYYVGIEKKYDNFRSIQILVREIYKYIRTSFFLILGDIE